MTRQNRQNPVSGAKRAMNGRGNARTLFARAFHATRTPRSPAYREGVLVALRFRLGELAAIRCPYAAGTAEADAFHSGVDEGHAIARRELKEKAR